MSKKTKQAKANRKNAEFFSNQENTKYIAEYIAKQSRANQKREIYCKISLSNPKKTVSQKGLMRIAKMQNLTQNELDQITKMQN